MHTGERGKMEQPDLEALADAITAVANRRSRIPRDHLLRETALNILILARIASALLDSQSERDRVDRASGHLADLLRGAADKSKDRM